MTLYCACLGPMTLTPPDWRGQVHALCDAYDDCGWSETLASALHQQARRTLATRVTPLFGLPYNRAVRMDAALAEIGLRRARAARPAPVRLRRTPDHHWETR